MSDSVDTSLSPRLIVSDGAALAGPPQSERVFDWRSVVSNPLFKPLVVVTMAMFLAFLPLWRVSFDGWVEPDSLYSHGPLIPILAAYILWIRWPKLKTIPAKPFYWAILVLIPTMYLTYIAARTEMKQTESILFLVAAAAGVWFVAGGRWALAVAPIIAFMSFCFPLWTSIVDHYTLQMQHLSADMAVTILQLCQLHPIRTDPTTVYLDHFTLSVAAACSGAKLTLALAAFTAFFMLTRTAKVWANIFLAAILVPFCLLVNGIRIAMVGIVGDSFGDQVGRQFHDYGGYIALVICFLLLSWITKALGYK